MRFTWPVFVVLISSCAQNENASKNSKPANWGLPKESSETNSSTDAGYDVTCITHDIANNPFSESDALGYFLSAMNLADSAKVKLRENVYSGEMIDTVHTIFWSRSYIEYSNNEYMEDPLLEIVELRNQTFKLKNGIKVGDSVEVIFETLGIEQDRDWENATLCIESTSDVSSYLYLVFELGTLTQITYLPYVG